VLLSNPPPSTQETGVEALTNLKYPEKRNFLFSAQNTDSNAEADLSYFRSVRGWVGEKSHIN